MLKKVKEERRAAISVHTCRLPSRKPKEENGLDVVKVIANASKGSYGEGMPTKV